MIKAIITDIDGVIVGDKKGINFPLPNDLVIQKLRELHKKGLPIIFCTAKYKSGIIELVKKTQLSNPHITDGGALIIDPLDNLIIQKHTISKESTKYMVSNILKNNIYLTVYGVDDYFVQRDTVCEITKKHTLILQQEPELVDSLLEKISETDVIKIILYAQNEKEKNIINSLVNSVKDQMHVIWTIHPTLLPLDLCILTMKGVSKKTAAQEVFEYLNISFEETLGIGDTLGDWNFMNLCKYAATVGEINPELKEKVKSKGEGNYLFAPSVDENGFLDVINFFIK